MSVPGMAGGMYQTNGLEHDERGRPCAMYATHERMNAKRYRKLEAVGKKYRMFRRFGDEKPDIGILSWGSSAGAVQEAVDQLRTEGIRVAAFVPQMLMPLPAAEMQAFVDSCGELLVVELSCSGQFHQYLRAQIDLPRQRTRLYARSGGKTLSVSEVIREVRLLARERVKMEVLA